MKLFPGSSWADATSGGATQFKLHRQRVILIEKEVWVSSLSSVCCLSPTLSNLFS